VYTYVKYIKYTNIYMLSRYKYRYIYIYRGRKKTLYAVEIHIYPVLNGVDSANASGKSAGRKKDFALCLAM